MAIVAILARWDLRRRVWFLWGVMVVLVLMHIPLIRLEGLEQPRLSWGCSYPIRIRGSLHVLQLSLDRGEIRSLSYLLVLVLLGSMKKRVEFDALTVESRPKFLFTFHSWPNERADF